MLPAPRISVAFFGITRSLSYTIDSIRSNIFASARGYGDVFVCCHFFHQSTINNPRSGEKGLLDPEEYKLLEPDQIEFSKPNTVLEGAGFELIKSFGDHWGDEFKSVSNLLHQLYSLKAATRLALKMKPDIVIFCRPDLLYHDSMRTGIQRALASTQPKVMLPQWQRHQGGYNDRFAICAGDSAIKAYGNRLDQALPFCHELNIKIHSERLTRYALSQSGVRVGKLNVRASRIRSDGGQVAEDFSQHSWKQFRNAARFRQMLMS